MQISKTLNNLLNGKDLTAVEMTDLMKHIMTGQAEDAQIGAVLAGLRVKGTSIIEISSAAKVMRSLSTAVAFEDKSQLVDTCGTGGDGAGLFNISTASAFVAAAAGVKVAKHGNRSNTSQSGSSDVLSAAGVNLNLTAEQVSDCIKTLGIGFLFAPTHHSAMKHVVAVRKSLGVRTIFNLLGPLTNPAGALNQVLGVFSPKLLKTMAEVLRAMGSRHVLVVHSNDGLDEISTADITQVAELKNGEIIMQEIDPSDYDCRHENTQDLVVSSPQQSLALIEQALNNAFKPATDMIRLNAGAAIYVAGLTPHYIDGVELATQAIESGKAWQLWQDFVAYTNKF